MKVILLKDIRGVGQRHQVKEVADGYAVNALFPKGLAEPATPQKVAAIEAAEAAKRAQAEALEQQLHKKIDSLRGKSVVIKGKTTPKGGLFKGITAEDVARAIREQHSLEILPACIQVTHPIKAVGEHTTELVGARTKAALTVVVSAA